MIAHKNDLNTLNQADERVIKNGRAHCVHFFRTKSGFTLIELLIALSVLAALTSMSFIPRTQSAEQKAIEEAKNLADWLEHAFIKSNITKQRFRIIGSSALSPNFYISWITASSTKNEIYSSDGRALFTVPSGGVIEYNPVVNFLDGQLGMTIRVHSGSDVARGKVIRYVIISRFGRVRVSEFPP
jgi:prepilin-type N-terminal cleavage/methylation domain-containing protein